ncbi:DUF1800 domain-containing protein [Donghicola sp. C2-DW-16]|uniref:DUF1800 domain-containing protein n=1 Tax=Donghicola mangrovi TaxID=2729614 RepID=A0ABX2PGN9_9RHOB|nr:DUF1800 domain-containing protein [Donghicola mangrovi]NVO28276.1 DUF1800 domain-containing protein [Donghicola mangrovi]
MVFDPALAEIRFGTGLSPRVAAPQGIDDMLRRLAGSDQMAQSYPIPRFDGQGGADIREYRDLLKARNAVRDTEAEEPARKALTAQKRKLRQGEIDMIRAQLLRGVMTEDGFRERLVWFWSDHFATAPRRQLYQHSMAAYPEQAIRPHVAGRFADMLWAAATHPVMQVYLDQQRNFGPTSVAAEKRPKKKLGLNENLAREMLELHTLGVGGGYTQADVTGLAGLLTGLNINEDTDMVVRPNYAERGPFQILGRSWGGDPKTREVDIREFIEDLARNPVTLRHLTRKLAVHFVADQPDEGLVEHMAAAMIGADGDLSAGYRAMLEHPVSWDETPANVKPPFDFMVSAMRALDVHPAMLERMNPRNIQALFLLPMSLMGQSWQRPNGPDGFPEADDRWISPQGLAERIQWSMTAPQTLTTRLPDPRAFVQVALGDRAPEAVQFAAKAAETEWEGVGLILSSPAFQRR